MYGWEKALIERKTLFHFLDCVFSNVSSYYLGQSIHKHIGCNCLIFISSWQYHIYEVIGLMFVWEKAGQEREPSAWISSALSQCSRWWRWPLMAIYFNIGKNQMITIKKHDKKTPCTPPSLVGHKHKYLKVFISFFSNGQEIFDKSVDSLRSFLLNPVAHLMMMIMMMTLPMVRDDDGNGDDYDDD